MGRDTFPINQESHDDDHSRKQRRRHRHQSQWPDCGDLVAYVEPVTTGVEAAASRIDLGGSDPAMLGDVVELGDGVVGGRGEHDGLAALAGSVPGIEGVSSVAGSRLKLDVAVFAPAAAGAVGDPDRGQQRPPSHGVGGRVVGVFRLIDLPSRFWRLKRARRSSSCTPTSGPASFA